MRTGCSRLFASAGVPYEYTRDAFDQPDKRVTSEVFEREAAYWHDACHPRRADGSRSSTWDSPMPSAPRRSTSTAQPSNASAAKTGRRYCYATPAEPATASDLLGRRPRRSALGLLPQEEADTLRSSSLENLTAEAVENLDDEERMGWAWAIIFHVLGDLPPPDDLKERIKRGSTGHRLGRTRTRGCADRVGHPTHGFIASGQFGRRSCASRLKDRLVDSARHFAEEGRRAGAGEIDVRAPEQQQELRSSDRVGRSSLGRGRRRARIRRIRRPVVEVDGRVASSGGYNKLVALRMCEELDATTIKPFWRVLNRLRAQ